MSKKIKVEEISMNVDFGSVRYLDIDVFRFVYDETEGDAVQVFLHSGGTKDTFLAEMYRSVDNDEDLKRVALNWIFDNVEIVAKEKLIENGKEE